MALATDLVTGLEFTHTLPRHFLLVGALVAIVWIGASYWFALSKPRGWAKFFLPLVRLATISGIVLCLLDPQRVTRIEHQQPARMAVLVDTSRSMTIQDLAPNRLEACKDWVQSRLMPNKPAGLDVTFYAFSEDVAGVSSNATAAAETLSGLTANGKSTAISDALEKLLNISDTETLTGVILCSDGIDTAGIDPTPTARLYRRKGIPIHTVLFGTTNEVRDVAIENLQVKRSVPNEAPARVFVRLRGASMGGRTVPVELRQNDLLIARTNVLLSGGSQIAELNFTPVGRGFQIFQVSVPPQPGEWLSYNNRRRFGLDVMESKLGVLYMEGSPTQARQPEWKYLKDALESDPNIKVKVLFRPQITGSQNVNLVDTDPGTGDKIYHVQHPTQGYPRTLAGLLQYDVVINSDIYKEAFSPEQMDITTKLVEEYGGGFIMIGGQTSFGAGGYHKTVLDRFIPVAMESDRDMNWQTFRMAVPTEAFSHPLIAIGNNLAETKAIWTQKFPPLHGYNQVGRAKPGAVVLAIDPSASTSYGPRIILAAQQVGRGRTMAFTSDTTRGWGSDFETVWGEKINPSIGLNESNCDSRYYRRFWINAMRWLSAGKVTTSNGPVALELDQSVCRPNDKVEANIRVLDAQMQESSDATVSVTLVAENRTNQPITANFDPSTRRYRASLAPSTTGDYSVIATAMLGRAERGTDKQLLTCEEIDPEMVRPQANPALMATLARVSGGNALTPQSGNVTSLFGNVPPVTVEVQKHPLWDKSVWLALLAGLLACEWIIRRLRGMP